MRRATCWTITYGVHVFHQPTEAGKIEDIVLCARIEAAQEAFHPATLPLHVIDQKWVSEVAAAAKQQTSLSPTYA